MKWGEECPYVTPCGWCSRQNEPCKSGLGRKRQEQYGTEVKVNESVLVDVAAALKEG